MRCLKSIFLASTLLTATSVAAKAEVNVVASIKPVHSLVAAVMDGVGEPGLIVEGAGSPHTYSLKPSQAQMLEDANLVFWIGHELEAFLEGPIETLAADAESIELIDAHDLVKLDFREGGAFDAHDHDDHDDHDDHAGHDDHDHDKEEHAEHDHDDHDHDKEEHAEHDHDDHDHDKEEHAEHDHDHDHDKEEHAEHDHDHDKEEHAEHDHDDHGHDHEEHAHGEFDPHVWLDPINAKALVHEIEEALVEADPDNAETYEANADALMERLDELAAEVSAELEPIKGKGFVVFHDAYQNFENRFGLSAVGSITVSPEVIPGAERIAELRDKVQDLSATCVFSEPQFEPKIVTTVVEGTDAKTGVLDPLGAGIEDGPDLYFTLIRNMSTSFKTCLSEAS